ncbi:MAG: nitroreductase [Oscillospiraceae bacterium]|nr:nitroreductase [Oscillospiraceae bacterium]
MNMLETVKTRRSVRTFDGNPLTQADREKLAEFIQTIQNPYEIPVEFVLLDAKANGLSSPVLAGDTMYVAAKVGMQPHAEEAFGYSFEKLVLYAWSLGIGTTWIGGTMKRELFEKAALLKDNEIMPCISPLGYPAKKMSVRETMMRRGVKADERKPASELFFDRAFFLPLKEENNAVEQALEMVRYAPSAVNRQPWRVVREGKNYHFYLKHDKGYINKATGDLQKVDMGIAICHFMIGVESTFAIADPGIPAEAGVEYIGTVTV